MKKLVIMLMAVAIVGILAIPAMAKGDHDGPCKGEDRNHHDN